MAETKPKPTAKPSEDKAETPATAGWKVVTQRVDSEGNALSTRTFQLDGPADEAKARKQIEEGLSDGVSIAVLEKLES